MRSLFVATLAAAALTLLLGSPADAAGHRHHHRHWHHSAHHHHHATHHHARRQHVARVAPIEQAGFAAPGGGGGGGIVATARGYLGTNPTGRRSLWCGAFMDLVLRQTGHRGGGNLAKGYLRYGTRVAGPQVGAIAVMGRRGGGHVGVVSGVDPHGNPIIISGNHGRAKTGESVYPRGRILAYVLPTS